MLLFVAAAGCARRSGEEAYRQAWSAYAQGQILEAANRAARAAEQWQQQPQSPWFHRFRLLHAESLMALGKSAEAEAILAKAIINKELGQLEVRRLVDLAAARSGRGMEATDLLAQARSRGPGSRDGDSGGEWRRSVGAAISRQRAGSNRAANGGGRGYQGRSALLASADDE